MFLYLHAKSIMKYYLIVGEASGDLHASHLMSEIAKRDDEAEFRFFGGDMMTAVGEAMPAGRCTRVKHYKELAYMGFIPVLLHLRTIFSNMAMCKKDIMQWQPDALILVDYPGFNLDIAKYIKALNTKHETLNRISDKQPNDQTTKQPKTKNQKPKTYYYIAPKIWAWKEYRIKNIKRDVDKLFSILPFEVPFFEQKHGYPINYVGNPTAQEVREFEATYTETKEEFCQRHGLDEGKEIIAVLPGSRKQELKSNLTKMLGAIELTRNTKHETLNRVSETSETFETSETSDYQIVIAGAPGLEPEFYGQFIDTDRYKVIFGETYKLLHHAHAALVVSGTATLETALFKVPQVVVYETGWHWLFKTLRKYLLKVKWVSLVNLIANREVVPEQVADTCTVEQIAAAFAPLLDDNSPERQAQLAGYDEVLQLLGDKNAPEEAARIIEIELSRELISEHE